MANALGLVGVVSNRRLNFQTTSQEEHRRAKAVADARQAFQGILRAERFAP